MEIPDGPYLLVAAFCREAKPDKGNTTTVSQILDVIYVKPKPGESRVGVQGTLFM